MLSDLRIQNFALIEKASVSFYTGESVVTGETGSGKSLFVDALDFIRGARSDQRIRRGQQKASVEAIFTTDDLYPEAAVRLSETLQKADIPQEDTLILRRELSLHGSRQRINDVSVTQQTLRNVASLLIDIHAQNAQSLLKNPKTYLPMLDASIGDEAQQRKEQIQHLLEKKRFWEKQKQALALEPEEVEREKDLLTYQMREIDEADLPNLDEDALNREYRSLISATERMQLAGQVLEAISGDHHALKFGIQNVAQALDDLAHRDKEATELRDMMWQIDAELDTVRSEVRRYQESVIVDPMRIHEIDSLFRLLQGLKRKYGADIAEILAFREKAEKEFRKLQDITKEQAKAESALSKIDHLLETEAEALHKLRQQAALKLEERVRDEMLQMAIQRISFAIPFSTLAAVGPTGKDAIDFYLSTNPGEPMKPLAEVASGGEMSRFMLALKIVASEISGMPTLVFDEIDTGISGRTAQVVAEKLARLSQKHQVLVITHLPQIAALSHHHYRIQKHTVEERTVSEMEELGKEGRIAEQARLIGGVHITDVTRSSAMEMLEQAKSVRDANPLPERKSHDG